ncbi:hypothetical protein M2158_009605 [Streptomyces sp. SAI-144]|uniref:hypothetical protein n=1 Tax=unclassified Streptomyces TaxID=2593676 RepID=UPI002473E155|nr:MULTISPECIES: hypothetical protein [unclassified Streptomyces]MDH6441064.1 hypothetical protein [Streptomyces sp. SAI-144]MDH6488366.1 hypothetical protein [Streptomyces sp. SAI-127]
MRRRKRIGTSRAVSLRRVRDRSIQRREGCRPGGWRRRFGRRAEQARPWLQFLADLATLLARVVR